ncbi:30S ribosomal protein S9 [Corynebacterium sp. P7003]|uniref:Small ribosomal subunit protein uS9 n=1 Tax=Corynebacterium pygosceleis TaxID=2800406 RepID=A0ABT3WRR8_9CORY|nr:30S ribosomal protein S9 [Corynebacterium pygosceleis]MCX7444900.1 30S ribosomal protein S9 [Corynebacterium pygosceleis]
MTENNNNEPQASDIAAAQAATEEFTTTIGDAIAPEATDSEPDAPVAPAELDHPIQTVGRRKRAIVRVRMTAGSGEFFCNGRSLEDYFPNKLHQQLIKAPLVLIDREGQFDIHANLGGGGPTGQAGAFRLAIARALISYNPADRDALKKAGFLTRDARAVERKKAGLHKARRAPQYSKR